MMTHSASPRQRAGEQIRRQYPLWRLVAANGIDLLRLLRLSWFALLGFAALVLGTAAYLRFLYTPRLTTIQALYESLRLLIFQSSLTLPADGLGEALFFIAPIVGILLVVQSVVTFGRGFLDKRSRLASWQVSLAATYRQQVIVCGLGRVGMRVVQRLLEAGHEPVVIEASWDAPHVRQALRMKVPVIVGDARDPDVLRQAQATRARAVIASIDGDLVNIEIALVVRALRPRLRVVLRAFSDELDANLEHAFGAGSAFSSSGLAAPTFFAAAISREIACAAPISASMSQSAAVVGISEIEIGSGSPLVGPVERIEQNYNVRALLLNTTPLAPRNARLRRAASRAKARAGDCVTLVGALESLESARLANRPDEASQPQRPNAQLDTVIICGLGKVGFRVARLLDAMSAPPRIVVIDRDLAHEDLVAQVRQMEHVTLIQGDATAPETLLQAGLQRAYSLAALSSDDQTNLRIGLAARGVRRDVHVTLRVFSPTLAEELAPLFGIHTAYSTSELSSPTLALAGLLGGIERAFSVERTPFVIHERTLSAQQDGDGFVGATIAELRQRTGILVVALRRGETLTLIPPLTTRLESGDQVTALGLAEVVGSLSA